MVLSIIFQCCFVFDLAIADLGVLEQSVRVYCGQKEHACVCLCVNETEGSVKWALCCDCKLVQATVELGLEMEFHS